MELIEVFKIIILKIDLSNIKSSQRIDYEHLRQELGVNIDTSLAGPRSGQWIGGRTRKQKIYLFFRVSDPSKTMKLISRLLDEYKFPSGTKIRLKKKTIMWQNYALV
jgi:hypothetical protein